MGIIMRNGIPYGGTDNDFIVVDSLNSVSNPKTECLYCVNNQLYFYENNAWQPIGGGDSSIFEVSDNRIPVGNSNNSIQDSPFSAKEITYPLDGAWQKYRGKSINIIGVKKEQNKDYGLTLIQGDDTEQLSAPCLGISENAKVFFEEDTDLDISGNTQIFIHDGAAIHVDKTAARITQDGKRAYANNMLVTEYGQQYAHGVPEDNYYNNRPFAIFRGNPVFHMENAPTFRMKDVSSFNMAGGAAVSISGTNVGDTGPALIMEDMPVLNMQDNATLRLDGSSCIYLQSCIGNSSQAQTYGGPTPSPTISMTSLCNFIMSSMSGGTGPVLIADQTQIGWSCKGAVAMNERLNNGQGTSLSNIANIDLTTVFDVGGNTSFPFATYQDLTTEFQKPIEPAFRVGGNMKFIADGQGYNRIKIGANTNGALLVNIDPASYTATNIKIGSAYNLTSNGQKDGKITIIFDGSDSFTAFKNRSHFEIVENSVFSMRGDGDSSNIGSSEDAWLPETYPLFPSEHSSSLIMNDVARFVMRGTRSATIITKRFSNGFIPSGDYSNYLTEVPYGSLTSQDKTTCDTLIQEIKDENTKYDFSNSAVSNLTVEWDSETQTNTLNFVLDGEADFTHVDKVSNSPILELIENAEIRAEGTGSFIVKSDSVEINGVEFTNQQLQALKQLLN